MAKRKKRRNQASSKPSSSDLLAHLQSRASELPREIEAKVAALQLLLTPLDPAAVLTALAENFFRERLSGGDPSLLLLEHTTWLFLLQREFQYDEVTDSRMKEVVASVEDIESDFQALSVASAVGGEGSPQELAIHAKNSGLWMRSPGFRSEEIRSIERLFLPLDARLSSALGFSSAQALALEEAILRGILDKIKVSVRSQERFRNDTFVFSAEELATRSNLPLSIASAYLEAFSLAAGQSHPGKDLLPTRVSALESRPILRLSEGRYLCHLVAKLIWAIRPVFEESFKEDWHSYDTVRAKFLEKEAADTLSQLGGHYWSGLCYRMKSAPHIQHELDVLWNLETHSVLAECKAGQFSLASQRGAPRGVMTDLRELVTKADEQLRRAEQQLLDVDSGGFDTKDGVVQPATTHVYTIAITLDSVPFTTQDSLLAEHSILSQIGKTWIVTIHDLRCIIHILRTPSFFFDYVARRLKIQSKSIYTADELDLLGIYLRNQLEFDSDGDAIALGSFADEIDEYFNSKELERENLRPALSFAPVMTRLVETLERRKCSRYLEGAFFLLREAPKLEAAFKGATEEKRGVLSTQRILRAETTSQILLILISDGCPREEDLQGEVEAVSRASTKAVLGIGTSRTSRDSICVCFPNKARP